MYILLIMSIFGVTIMFWKMIAIIITIRRKEQILTALYEKISKESPSDMHQLERCFSQEINAYLMRLEMGLNFVRTIAAISPLLGLLGTVIGILFSFEVISAAGLDNPTLFAEGISIALITTAGGLIVSIPHYVGYSCLTAAIDRLEASWNRQSVYLLQKSFQK